MSGDWEVVENRTIVGTPFATTHYVSLAKDATNTSALWTLKGVVSNLRYTTVQEKRDLTTRHADLGRETAKCAVLIPIRKSPDWWALAQDERRAIYERSNHTLIGLDYLPAIARRLHHSRDLGEPFDFLTWFEFAEADEPAFDQLLGRLRASEEWHYVDWEVEMRLRFRR